MAVNNAAQFGSDIGKYIQKKTLELTQKQLVVSQIAEKVKLPKGMGTTYYAYRYERVPLPVSPLSEGTPATGQPMTVTQVTGTAQQWGDLIRITDVAELTIFHPVFQKAIDLLSLQASETIERNTFNALMGGTQVNYVGAVGSRASLTSGSVMTPHELNRALSPLFTNGARYYSGDRGGDLKTRASDNPMGVSTPAQPHYVAVIHPNVELDLRENSTVVTAWSYSDVNKLYNSEIGQWSSIRFTRSNMVPYWTGIAAVSGTAGTSGSLATGSYYVVVTGSDATYGYERLVSQVSASVSVTGPNGSISVTVPSTPGYLYNVYIGTTATPGNLALSPQGPTSGSMAGTATQLQPGSTVVLTGVGPAQVPPAAPATGVTVYPTFIFGKESFAQVDLDAMQTFLLTDPDKADPQNQTRVVSWKIFYGTMIMNNQFFMRIESSSAFNATFG